MKQILLFLLLGTALTTLEAQERKKPLDHSVYDSWQSIASEAISNDGKWVLYAVNPQEGDASLVIMNRETGKELKVGRGSSPAFTEDSRFAVFLIKPYFKDVRAAKIKKTKAADMPKDSLAILNMGNLSLKKIPMVKSFKLPDEGAGSLAYLRYSAADSSKSRMKKNKKDEDRAEGDPPGDDNAEKEGEELVIVNLVNGTEKSVKYVTEYLFSKDGKSLALASAPSKKDTLYTPGIYLYNTTTYSLKKISSGMGPYKNLSFDRSGSKLAFTAEREILKDSYKYYKLCYYTPGLDSALIIADEKSKGVPPGWGISNNGTISFSRDGKKLFFGTAPLAALKDTSIVDFEVAKVDIWNYKDDYLQPMQLKNLDKELKRAYLAVVYPESPGKIIQLADEKIPKVILADEGNAAYVLGITDYGYRAEIQWTGAPLQDLYLISLADGNRKKIAGGIRGKALLSPSGRYAVWYNRKDRQWCSFNIPEQRLAILNKDLIENFYDESNDVPDDPSAYGLSAFVEGDQGVLIYDKYDIWRFDLNGGKSRNITNGFGRKNNLRFRYFNFMKVKDRAEDDFIEVVRADQTLFIDAFDYRTRQGGWYKTSLRSMKDPERLSLGSFSYSRPVKAKYANFQIYKKENYVSPPDLYVSSDFRREKKLSTINPQQKEYNWGTAELVSWKTRRGFKSDGILYKPEDFDANKKYPMIVYFYEKLSDNLYNYIAPAPTPSRLNISYFVSNGYLVFAPDISYETGYPGRSAEEFINSGVEELKKKPWVDGSKIGIQGQSWGGYQVAHLITRTNMYAAAWAGAPVVNMTSAYGGIRWETGMNRQFQYERTQSRIGATLWEKPELYIENSPLFHLPKVNTPVVIMANDADGAVPWYQGIEMFTALRRLNKPVWMLNYNNEAHNLMLRQNRKDIQRREQQFFDHYLKGEPAPLWMEKGVPATEKGRNWGFDLTN